MSLSLSSSLLSFSCEKRMATMVSSTPSLDKSSSVQFLVSRSKLHKTLGTKLPGVSFAVSPGSKFRVFCESKTQELQIRRCSPLLEKASLSSKGVLVSDEWKAVPDIWRSSAEKYGDRVAVVDPYRDPPTTMTYKQLEQEILDFAEGLRVIGVKPEEKHALFADNSCRWLVADQGMMATGAINVVRGSRSSVEELLHLYNHSESVGLVVDNPEFFNRIAGTFCSNATMRFIVLLWGEKSCLASGKTLGVPVFSYNEIMKLGRESRVALSDSHDARQGYKYETIGSDDIATLVYTSGTTGNPKGVMITHKNLLHQIGNLGVLGPAKAGDRFLSMLPTWHAYERACEYFIFTRGIEQVYTNVRNLKDDLRNYQPDYMISVPLVYETLYSGIQKQISASSNARKLIALLFIRVSLAYTEMERIYEGLCLTKNQKQPSYLVAMLDCLWARIVAAILWPLHMLAKKLVYGKIHAAIGISKVGKCGGGSLPVHIEKFYEAIGLKMQNGYGLTETSPCVAGRRPECNVLGSVGHPIPLTEFKIVDAETDEILPHGSKGIIKVRGPNVMKGYYKNPLATRQALDEDGWLNTGDIGWIAPHHSVGRSRRCGGVIVLEGRAKDTIVLSSGENVEPLEIEEAALRSALIQQIVVIGQDQRRLGAIIVPNKDELLQAAKNSSIVDAGAIDLGRDKMTSLLYEELRKWTSECSFQIGPILVVDEPFTIESGLLTPTMKIRRDRVVAQYKEEIANLFK
ncbi:probable acyl-activating enzyme 16, chloroplastic [Durio zibethinus]|uniref:Probable acyl-activating enzyme 16, chloroplastic n=1 Tax=Durio zibethinus TaxID=66656 RepID=A0A6P5Y0J2_DURZI|nr:probable acyl-activating enzyme 16, chloroplastic [Durio zibethinus]